MCYLDPLLLLKLEPPTWGIVCSVADVAVAVLGIIKTTDVDADEDVDADVVGRRRGNIRRRTRPREESSGLDVNGAYFSTSMMILGKCS